MPRACSPTTAPSSPSWAPTPAYDEWAAAARRRALGACWRRPGWRRTRAAHLVGTTPAGASGTVNALGPDAHWPPVRVLRRDVLELLADAPAWRRHGRRPLGRRCAGGDRGAPRQRLETVVEAVLREAEWLGVTGRGALSSGRSGPPRRRRRSSPGRGDAAPPPRADRAHPAPGRPDRHRARPAGGRTRDLPAAGGGHRVARWGHGVPVHARHRATRPRRRLVGRPGARRRWATPARPRSPSHWTTSSATSRAATGRHGSGAARAYIRCDDETTLGAMLAERALSPLQLRSIAPDRPRVPGRRRDRAGVPARERFRPRRRDPGRRGRRPRRGTSPHPPAAAHRTGPFPRRRRRAGDHTGRCAARRRGVGGIPARGAGHAVPDPPWRAPTRPRPWPSCATRPPTGRPSGSATPTRTGACSGSCSIPTASRAGGCTAPPTACAAHAVDPPRDRRCTELTQRHGLGETWLSPQIRRAP